jgi:hypothetical protein
MRASQSPVARAPLALEALESREVPAVTLVSAADPSFSSTSSTANGQSETSPEHSLSSDGKYLVYISTGYNLVANQTRSGGTTTTQNVYLYDTSTKTTTLLSHNASTSTQNGNGDSFDPVISADGSTVAFFSTATDLISGDTIGSGTVQLYLYDVASGDLTLVTHDSSDSTKGGDATNPFIPSGSVSGSTFNATNTLGYYAGDPAFSLTGGGIGLPSLSSDGKYVAFISNATNLGFTMPTASFSGTALTQVFLYDVSKSALTLVSHEDTDTTTGGSSSVGDSFSSTVAISADGSTVAFTTPFDDLISGESVDGVSDQLYVWSRIDNTSTTGLSAGETVLASHTASSTSIGTTIDSTQFLFGFTGDTPPALSKDGTYVAYYDAGDDLISSQGGTASVLNVFRYDVKNNSNTLVTHVSNDTSTAGDNPANQIAPGGVGPAEATGPAISDDGRYIAFANNSSNLISPSFGTSYDGRDQVYLWDASTGKNVLVSHADGSATSPSSTGGTAPSMSSNGRYVSYVDWAYPASNTSSATSAEGDVRIFDRDASDGTTIPTSFGTAFDSSLDATTSAAILAPTVLSSDGHTVAWDGSSTSNVSNDNNKTLDVFFNTDLPPAPTNLQTGTLDVPALNSTHFTDFTTTAAGTGRTFTYSLVTGTGSTDNSAFTVSPSTGALSTNSSFTSSLQSTYDIRARTTDADFPSVALEKTFQLTLVHAPTGISLSQSVVPNLASTSTGQVSTTSQDTGRTFTYSLVSGTGSTDNADFAINSSTGEISTVSSFSPGSQTTFNIRVRSTDSEFSGLFVEKTFSLTLLKAPTSITSNTTGVPSIANTATAFATLSTAGASGRTFTYSLVSGTGSTDNSLFTIDSSTGVLSTAASGFPASGQTSYSIRVRTEDSQYSGLFVEKVFTFTLVSAPSNIQLSNSTFVPADNRIVGSLSVPGSSRTYTYSLVSGTGSTDNSNFVINGKDLTTGSGFPTTAPTTYSVRVRVTDSEFTGLTFEKVFTLSAVNAPAPPTLSVPSAGVSGFQGTAAALNISASPGDSTSTVSVTISNVPAGVTFSAGTNNGNGSWTFTPAQLTGLKINVPTPGSFTLNVDATASFTAGGGTTSTTSGTLAVTMQSATPTVSVSTSTPTFNPLNGLTVDVSSVAPGTEVVQSVTVNWGDGTVQTFSGAPGEYTHHYAVVNGTYAVDVSVTDQNGTFSTTSGAVVTAALPPKQQVVAALYLDILGRSADPTGLAEFSQLIVSGVPVNDVIDAMMASNEYQTKVVNDLYMKYLGRPVDSSGLTSALGFLESGGQVEVLAAHIIASPEFYNKAGGTDEGFLKALYLDVLGRPIDPVALSTDLVALGDQVPGVLRVPTASRQEIALNVLLSDEAALVAVEAAYQTYLGRPADSSALPAWEQQYMKDPAGFLVAFLSSPEISQQGVTAVHTGSATA